MITAAADIQAWQQVRAVLSGRRERPSRGDVSYAIYLTVLVVIVVVFPVLRAVALGLALPEFTATVAELPVQQFTSAGLAACAAGVTAVGRVRGAIVPREPFLDVVVASPIRRAITLRGAAVRTGAVLAAAAVLMALVLAWSAALSSSISVLGAAVFLLACALLAGPVLALWLIGQLGGRLRAGALLALGAVTVVLVPAVGIPAAAPIALWSGPWGWIVLVWQAVSAGVTAATGVALALLVIGCLLSVLAIPRLLNRLERDDLARQSRRWSAITALAVTGDMTSAAAKLSALPRRGRAWPVTFSRHPVLAIVRRDLLGIARFPVRAALLAVVTTVLGAALAVVMTVPGTGAIPTYLAPVLAYFAIGGWAGGLRMHGFTLGPASPFGYRAQTRLLWHAVVPALTGAALLILGAVLVNATGIVGPVTPAVLGWLALLTAFFTVMQAFTAVKGPLPLELLAPIPTPMGDMSVVMVTIWLADAMLIVLLAGGATSSLASLGSPWAVPVLMIVTALMVAWTAVRIARLIRPVA